MWHLLHGTGAASRIGHLTRQITSSQGLRARPLSISTLDQTRIFHEQQDFHKTSDHALLLKTLKNKFDSRIQQAKTPNIFFSYSWFIPDLFPHENWVQLFLTGLYRDLKNIGFNVNLDIYDSRAGGDMAAFMRRGVQNSDFVMLIGTNTLREKISDPSREYAVKVEYNEIRTILNQSQHAEHYTKLIPIQLTGTDWKDAFPRDLFDERLAVEELVNPKLFTYPILLEFIVLTLLKRFNIKERKPTDQTLELDLERNITTQAELHSKLPVRAIQHILKSSYSQLRANHLFSSSPSDKPAEQSYFETHLIEEVEAVHKQKHNEQTFITVNETELFHENVILKDQRIYIQGDPGTGKSTWSKKMSLLWALGKTMRHFDMLMLIHLDELKAYSELREKDAGNFDELDLVCYVFHIPQDQKELAKEILHRINLPMIQTLYILDNYDAVARLSQNHPLYFFLKKLLAKRHLIMTGNMIPEDGIHFTRHFKMLGLHANNSKSFLRRCLLRYHVDEVEIAAKLNLSAGFFQNSREFLKLNSNPMFLQILSELLMDPNFSKNFHNSRLTDVYKRFLERLILRWRNSFTVESFTETEFEHHQESKLIASFLQAIAFEMYSKNNSTITYGTILSIYTNQVPRLSRHYINKLQYSGLLQPLEGSTHSADQLWSFVHHSIAHYLIAQKSVANIFNRQDNSVFADSLQKFPLMESAKQIWRCMCSLSRTDPILFSQLLNYIQQNSSRDGNHLFKKFELLVILMNETISDSAELLPSQKTVFRFIKDFVTWMMLNYKSAATRRDNNPYHYILKENTSVLYYPEMLNHLTMLLATKFPPEEHDHLDSLIFLIGEWKLGDPHIIHMLVQLSRDRRWYVRAESARALGKIGNITESVLHVLTEKLKTWDENERADAAEALGRLKVNQEYILISLVNAFHREQITWIKEKIADALTEYVKSYPELFNKLPISFKSPGWKDSTALLMALIRIYPFDKEIIIALFDNIFMLMGFSGGRRDLHTAPHRSEYLLFISQLTLTEKTKLYETAEEIIKTSRTSKAIYGIWLLAFLRIYKQRTTDFFIKLLDDNNEVKLLAEVLWAIGELGLNDSLIQQKVCQFVSHADPFVRKGALLAILGSHDFIASYQPILAERIKQETVPELNEMLIAIMKKQENLFKTSTSSDEVNIGLDTLNHNDLYLISVKHSVVDYQIISVQETTLLKVVTVTINKALPIVQDSTQEARTDKDISPSAVDALFHILTKIISYVHDYSDEEEIEKMNAARALSKMCFESSYAFDVF
jgi:hypothetical protein